MEEDKCLIKKLGNLYGEQFGTGFAGNVYDSEGISPAFTTFQGGGREPHILEVNKVNRKSEIVAMRGRGKVKTKQQLEKRSDGCTNSITTAQKDNLVLELNPMEDGTCRTLKNQYYKNTITNFDRGNTFGASAAITVKQVIKKEINKNAKHQQDLIQTEDDICKTIPCGTHGSTPHLLKTIISKHIIEKDIIPDNLEEWIWEIDGELYLIRIRKLTPKECWRLMGFSDEDFGQAEAVNSNTQLYKQAGNSIVKNVLMSVFYEMFKDEAEINPCLNCEWDCRKEDQKCNEYYFVKQLKNPCNSCGYGCSEEDKKQCEEYKKWIEG